MIKKNDKSSGKDQENFPHLKDNLLQGFVEGFIQK